MINENKIMLYGDDARSPIHKGMKKVYDAVRITMGPSGRNVLIEDELMRPTATKDGVTVARSIKLSDKKQDMGAQLIKSVSQKTADTSGDGTSTSTVLAFSLLDNGLTYLESNKDANLIDYKRGMDKATVDVVASLKENSIKCETENDIHKVAMISSNGDKEISDLVTSAVYRSKVLSKDGSITISTSNTFESSVEFNDAMIVHGGYGKAYPFVNNIVDVSVDYDNARVLVFDGSIGNILPSLLKTINDCVQNDEAIVLIANEFSPNVILNLTSNLKKGVKSVIIESPDSGTQRRNVLMDIAIATGTTVFGGEGSTTAQIERLSRDQLGWVKNVQVFTDKSYLKLGVNDSHAKKLGLDFDSISSTLEKNIEDRIVGILKSIEKSKNQYEIIQAKKRAENLGSIKSTINLYAMTDVEVNEMKQRAEDAVFATSSALEEGYVLGGGMTLTKIAMNLRNIEKDLVSQGYNKSFIAGYYNVLNSISRPFVQILNNAFLHPSEFDIIDSSKDYTMIDLDYSLDSLSGIDVRVLQKVDNMVNSGIIDPTKVLRCAIQNANSVSSIALTTECLIFSDAYYTEELSSKENHELMFSKG